MDHDLIAISAKCQKGEGIDTLNLLGIIHCLTGVFSEGRQILLEANSPTWSGRKAVNPSSQWDVKLSLLLSFTNGSPAFLEMGFSLSQPFFRGGICATDGRLPYYSHQRQLLLLSALTDGCDACSEFVGLGGSLHLKRQEKYRESFCGGNWWWFFFPFTAKAVVKLFFFFLQGTRSWK